MILADAVAEYVAERRSKGSPFVSTERTLLLFCKHAGPIELAEVTTREVAAFLNNGIAQVTQCSRFSGVKCFLEHYAARGLMPPLRLTPPAKPGQTRTPFIFTHTQVSTMLRNADRCQRRAFDLDGKTLRMVVLLLYATGATPDEVLTLRVEDVDRKKRTLHFRGTASRSERLLPMSKELANELASYLASRPSKHSRTSETLVLTSLAGRALRRGNLCARFQILQLLGVDGKAARQEGGVPDPTGRLQDLRYTFAVHRLKEWLAAGKDLHKLTPALSAYMGYASLMKSEDFLSFTPERFHSDLRKLTRSGDAPRWTEDSALMNFLGRL